jgi:ATP-binding cassette subfamily F protein uup
MAQLLSGVKISKSFSGRKLFTDLSFGIDSKDRIGLVGPNGAGKSTLLKILAKQVEPDSGQVVSQRGLRVGYLDQAPTFSPESTIISALSECDDDIASVYEWISKLNLSQFPEETLVTKLSGGWQKRVALAQELIKRPDLLLLDEPTNHLDISSILWLEDFLIKQPTPYMMITHDRLFLQRSTEKIWDLDPQNPNMLFTVNGGYDFYLQEKETLLAVQKKQFQVNKNTLRRETEWLRRGAKARQTKQKARGQAAASLKTTVMNLKEKTRDRGVELEFTQAERQPQKLIHLKHISHSAGGQLLWDDFSLLLTPKSRVALLGDNGTGKSTLLRIMTGSLSPQKGTIERAENLAVSYFEQSKETVNPLASTLKNICPDGDYVQFQGQFIYAKSYLERFQFSYEQMDLPAGKLSGGEKSRLRLAQMMLTSAQVLILDEPTNDLDIKTLESLQDSLESFQGAVVLVTHDRYFMDSIADQIIYINDKFPEQPRAISFADYWQWEEWFESQPTPPANSATLVSTMQNSDQSSNQNSNQSSNQSSKKVKMTYKDKLEFEGIEALIASIESELAACQNEILLPEVVANSARTQILYTKIHELTETLQKKIDRWAELEEIAKGSQA